jgi:hypothetical protein
VDWFKQLLSILSPPASAPKVADAEIAAIERSLGLRLPDDYKAFAAAYGTGTLDDFITVLTPTARISHFRLDDYGEEMLKVLRELRAGGEEMPRPIHPEPGGLLPWGVTSNGDWGYWVTDPAAQPDLWPVAVNVGRGPEWYEHPGPLTRFLREALDRTITIPFFPDDFPSDDPAFRRLPDGT